MRCRVALVGWAVLGWASALAPAHALAECRSAWPVVEDRGLHRAWVVVEDCLHPQRPAHLREIPWPAARTSPPAPAGMPQNPGPVHNQPLAVRPGMRVRVWKASRQGEISLAGTALEAGHPGERVLVRAGFGNAVLEGIVRGPALVELTAQSLSRKGGR